MLLNCADEEAGERARVGTVLLWLGLLGLGIWEGRLLWRRGWKRELIAFVTVWLLAAAFGLTTAAGMRWLNPTPLLEKVFGPLDKLLAGPTVG